MRFIASYVHAIATYVCICAIISDSLVDLSHIHTYVHTYDSIILSDKIIEHNANIIGNFCAKNTLHSGSYRYLEVLMRFFVKL